MSIFFAYYVFIRHTDIRTYTHIRNFQHWPFIFVPFYRWRFSQVFIRASSVQNRYDRLSGKMGAAIFVKISAALAFLLPSFDSIVLSSRVQLGRLVLFSLAFLFYGQCFFRLWFFRQCYLDYLLRPRISI